MKDVSNNILCPAKWAVSWQMLSPTGDFMCFLDYKRVSWYLRKELATKISDNQIQLNFVPGGHGSRTIFGRNERVFRCVVCSCDKSLTFHHVVPESFRRWINIYVPEYFKYHCHDVVYLCVPCHAKYEKASQLYRKTVLTDRYGVPWDGIYTKNQDHSDSIIVLAHYNSGLGQARRNFARLQNEVDDLVQKHPGISVLVSQSPLTKPTKKEFHAIVKEYFGYRTQSEIIAEQLAQSGEVDDFVQRWRNHFMSTMQPKFLTKGWRVDYRKQADYVATGK